MSKKTRGWPPERRAQQAERIRQTKPWLKTTGPKTKEGKATSAQNAYQHGFFSRDYKAVMDLLNMQAAFVTALNHDKVEE